MAAGRGRVVGWSGGGWVVVGELNNTTGARSQASHTQPQHSPPPFLLICAVARARARVRYRRVGAASGDCTVVVILRKLSYFEV